MALVVGVTTSCGDLVSSSDKIEVILPPAEELVDLIRGVDDASVRVIPTIGSGPNAIKLRDAFSAIERAFTAADAVAADRALNDARGALTGFAESPEYVAAVQADISVLEISLLAAGEAIQKPCATVPVAAQSLFASCK